MILSCPSCAKTYRTPSSAIPPGGRDVQCSACGCVWFERGQMAEAVGAGLSAADTLPRREAAVIEGHCEPARPRPQPSVGDEAPRVSPAREQQTALAIVYGPSEPLPAPTLRSEEASGDGPSLSEAADVLLRTLSERARRRAAFAASQLAAMAARLKRAPVAEPSTSEAAARATRRALQRRAANRLTPARALGWVAWAACVVGLVHALVFERQAVSRIFPPADRIFERGATPETPKGLRIEVSLSRYARSASGPAVVVTGNVFNDGDAAVPEIRLTAVTADGEETQVLPLPQTQLPRGGERPFTVRALVPEGTTGLAVSVVAGEAARPAGFVLQARGGAWDGHAGPPPTAGERGGVR